VASPWPKLHPVGGRRHAGAHPLLSSPRVEVRTREDELTAPTTPSVLARMRPRLARLREHESLRDVARACRDYAARRRDVLKAELQLERARRAGNEVVVGPFLSEVGFELLYWIPMLRQLLRRHGIPPWRVTAISRGGAGPWYRGVADGYIDVLDLFDPDEYATKLARRRTAAGDQKQVTVEDLDREILALALARLGARSPVVVHPWMMVARFRHYWAGEAGTRVLRRHAEFQPHVRPLDGRPPELPRRYVALKAYYSSCFPETDANRRFVCDLVERLAQTCDVVVLPNDFSFDDHHACQVPEGARIHRAERWMSPRDNLEVQSRIVSGADAMFSTYGGFSYLGTMLRVPWHGFYSERNYNPRHEHALRLAAAALDLPAPDPMDVRRRRAEDVAGVLGA
jgi:hypothetical protein